MTQEFLNWMPRHIKRYAGCRGGKGEVREKVGSLIKVKLYCFCERYGMPSTYCSRNQSMHILNNTSLQEDKKVNTLRVHSMRDTIVGVRQGEICDRYSSILDDDHRASVTPRDLLPVIPVVPDMRTTLE